MEIFFDLFNNTIFLCAVIGWFVAQIIKTIIHLILSKTFVAERLVGSGGMPSSHSATVCALLTATIIIYGVGGFEFAIASIVSIITMYDAMGVRRETGNQAKVLNDMMETFAKMNQKDMLPEEKLKEFIGHTPLQVLVGSILGIIIAIVVCFIRGIL